MEGTTINAATYSDNTNFIPANTAYELRDITKWQPLLETNRLGYFQAQTHITVQLRDQSLLQPFSMDNKAFFKKFTSQQDQEAL